MQILMQYLICITKILEKKINMICTGVFLGYKMVKWLVLSFTMCRLLHSAIGLFFSLLVLLPFFHRRCTNLIDMAMLQDPVYAEPLSTITGSPSMVQHEILNNRRHVLTKVSTLVYPFSGLGRFFIQDASFSGSFGSVKHEHSVVYTPWQDTAGSVKLWEITRGFMVADYGQVGLMALSLIDNWYGNQNFHSWLAERHWLLSSDLFKMVLLHG